MWKNICYNVGQWNGSSDPGLNVTDIMGPLSFQSFFPLTPAYGCLLVITLKTAACIICKFIAFHLNTSDPIGNIDVRIERFIMLQHTVNNP